VNKRIVIKIGPGSLETGYAAAVQIGDENTIPQAETEAHLPPAPDLVGLYEQWRAAYWQLGLTTRIKAKDGVTNVSTASDIEYCRMLSRRLRDRVHNWLDGNEFRPIREKLLEQLNPDDQARILLQTHDLLLQRLPWYELQFFERYRRAEVGICAPNYQQVRAPATRSSCVRILAVFGNTAGLNTQIDRTLLNQLNADIHFLQEPTREQFNRSLWDAQGWDILFFAGHSSSRRDLGISKSVLENPSEEISSEISEGRGEISLNADEKLTIVQLKHALKKAIDRGLNTAIFNSCDGLGLAADLASLHIPQVLVMREPVPDQVAHAFLQGFLDSFAAGASFYMAVREAREKMQGLEADFPCATWLPVIVQNLAETPPTWLSLQGKEDLQTPVSNRLKVPDVLPFSPHQPEAFSARSIKPLSIKHRLRVGIGAGMVIATALLCLRYTGYLEQWELSAYDQFIRAKPTENVDSQILIITNTDTDIQERPDPAGNSLSEETLLALLNKLTPLQPQFIGLDIYRDFAAQSSALANKLKTTDNLITVCKASDPTSDTPAIAPPPEIRNAPSDQASSVYNLQRVGSTDFTYGDEPGSVLRRHLLFLASQPPCEAVSTFSTLIAKRYLSEGHGVDLGEDYDHSDGITMGSVLWPVIPARRTAFGGYHHLDTQGLAILLNYRRLKDPTQTGCNTVETPADCLSVGEVLKRSPEDLKGYIQGRIVLIGTTALAFPTDRWVTPFTTTRSIEDQAPGVFLQAQMISQLINAELGSPPRLLYTDWPEWKKIIWVTSWAVFGGWLGASAVGRTRKTYAKLWLQLLMGEGLLLLACWLWLMRWGIWVPWIPSAIAFPAAAIAAQVTLLYPLAEKRPKQLSIK